MKIIQNEGVSMRKSGRPAIGTLVVSSLVLVAGLIGATTANALPSYTLCDISNGLDSGYEWMTDITLDSVSITPDFSTSDFYDASTEGAIPIDAGQSYSISVTVEADPANAGYWVENVVVWIDFNGDGVLNSSEIVLDDGSDTSTWSSTGSATVEATFTNSFLVPNNAVGGEQWARALNYDPDTTDDPTVTSPPCWDTSVLTLSGSAVDFLVDVTALAPSTYTVSFDANGGSAISSQTITHGTSLTLPAAPTFTGNSFNGWYSAATGGTLIGAANASYTPSSSVTLYAHWTADSNGGGTNGGGTTDNGPTLAETGAQIGPTLGISDALLSIGLAITAFAMYRRRKA